jgi:hypothetical protein
LKKSSNIKIHENPPIGKRVVPFEKLTDLRRTDKCGEATSGFSNFANARTIGLENQDKRIWTELMKQPRQEILC